MQRPTKFVIQKILDAQQMKLCFNQFKAKNTHVIPINFGKLQNQGKVVYNLQISKTTIMIKQ